MPDNKLAYIFKLLDGNFVYGKVFNDTSKIVQDWGETFISPMFLSELQSLSFIFPKKYRTKYFYTINKFASYRSNFVLPKTIYYYNGKKKIFKIDCKYYFKGKNYSPEVVSIKIFNIQSKKELIIKKNTSTAHYMLFLNTKYKRFIKKINYFEIEVIQKIIRKYL